MSGPETPSPNRRSEPSHSDSPSNNPPDPLLDSGTFIDPDRNDFGDSAETPKSPKPEEASRKVEFEPGAVIAAEPISVFIPGDDLADGAAPRSDRRRNPEEMAKRPSWLPEGWRIDLRVRSSGASAGLIDRYYFEPSGQRKFRSKNEVLRFLETGDKPKKKENVVPSGSPPSQKPKQSSTKSKKPDPTNSNTTPNFKRKKSKPTNSNSTPNSKGKKSKGGDAPNSDQT